MLQIMHPVYDHIRDKQIHNHAVIVKKIVIMWLPLNI